MADYNCGWVPKHVWSGRMQNSQQDTTGKFDCVCGYQGTSAQDLDEHCIAMADADDKEDHAAKRRC